MSQDKDTTAIFAKCSRLLSGISLKIGDSFFSELFKKESDKLLAEFVTFLKIEGEAGIARSGKIAQYENRVAQYCRQQLTFQIKNILNLLNILKYLNLTEPVSPLLLEKNLLLLELSVLNSSADRSPELKVGGIIPETSKKQNKIRSGLSETHDRILELIETGGKVQNSEIFGRLPEISKRTLKRKLSELIKSSAITRHTEGKKVFYMAVSRN